MRNFAPMKAAALHFNALRTGYGAGRHQVVIGQQLCGSLQQGELTALVGANGCGKSTLLRTLCGFIPPLAGDITLGQQTLPNYSTQDLARQLSIVLTEKPDTEYLTVAETVELGRLPHRDRSAQARAHAREVVERAMRQTGCAVLRARRLVDLSDGERQRVMVAKALAQETPVILLDEPTAFLDFPGKIAMMRLLMTLAKTENKAILMATHDLELIFQLAHRLWVLSPRGIRQGTPQELAARGTIAEAFAADGLRFDAETLRFSFIH